MGGGILRTGACNFSRIRSTKVEPCKDQFILRRQEKDFLTRKMGSLLIMSRRGDLCNGANLCIVRSEVPVTWHRFSQRSPLVESKENPHEGVTEGCQ